MKGVNKPKPRASQLTKCAIDKRICAVAMHNIKALFANILPKSEESKISDYRSLDQGKFNNMVPFPHKLVTYRSTKLQEAKGYVKLLPVK
jgi:hypothetical protein